jgi:hypothetical protein
MMHRLWWDDDYAPTGRGAQFLNVTLAGSILESKLHQRRLQAVQQ